MTWGYDPNAAMAVPVFFGVAKGLAFTLMGGLALLLVAVWWSWAGDGIEYPREQWPVAVRLLALLGWGCFIGGILGQLLAHFLHIGVASFPAP